MLASLVGNFTGDGPPAGCGFGVLQGEPNPTYIVLGHKRDLTKVRVGRCLYNLHEEFVGRRDQSHLVPRYWVLLVSDFSGSRGVVNLDLTRWRNGSTVDRGHVQHQVSVSLRLSQKWHLVCCDWKRGRIIDRFNTPAVRRISLSNEPYASGSDGDQQAQSGNSAESSTRQCVDRTCERPNTDQVLTSDTIMITVQKIDIRRA